MNRARNNPAGTNTPRNRRVRALVLTGLAAAAWLVFAAKGIKKDSGIPLADKSNDALVIKHITSGAGLLFADQSVAIKLTEKTDTVQSSDYRTACPFSPSGTGFTNVSNVSTRAGGGWGEGGKNTPSANTRLPRTAGPHE